VTEHVSLWEGNPLHGTENTAATALEYLAPRARERPKSYRRTVVVGVEVPYLSFRLTNSWQETPEVKVWMKKIEFMSTDVRDGWYKRNVDGRVKGIGQMVFSLCHRDAAPINFLSFPHHIPHPRFPLWPPPPPPTFNLFSMPPYRHMTTKPRTSFSTTLLPLSYNPATRPTPSSLSSKTKFSSLTNVALAMKG
jgi:hypothetical protein